jgi:hypothetical protein
VIKYLSVKNYLFIAALLLYPTISTPFPSNIGIAEILIGFLFVLSIDYNYLLPLNPRPFNLKFNYLVPLQIILFILLFVPTVVVVISSKFILSDYIRDVVPFLYIFIPYFYYSFIYSKFRWYLYLPWIISIMGFILSIRYLYVVYATHGINAFLNIGSASYGDELLYLTYDASVHFSAVFLFSSSILMLSKQKYLPSILIFFLGIVPFLGNVIIAQRAPTFLTIICVFAFAITILIRHFKRRLIAIVLVGILFLLIALTQFNELFPSLLNIENFPIFSKMIEKQEKFGVNAKDLELYTVLGIVFSSAAKLMFGIGWGSVFKDPIIPEVEVSFTHSAFTYFLLKTGVVGLTCFLLYLFLIFRSFFDSSFSRNSFSQNSMMSDYISYKTMVFLSALPAVIIGMFLQVSYKTLSFGVVLLSLLLFY